jgi:hypothetical protein
MLIDIARVITVIIEVIGTTSKSLRQHLSNIPEKAQNLGITQNNQLGTANILWKVLM